MSKKEEGKYSKLERAYKTNYHSKKRFQSSRISQEKKEICSPTPEQGTWIHVAKKEDLIDILDNLPCGFSLLGSAFGNAKFINRKLLDMLGYDLNSEPTSSSMAKKAFPSRKARSAAHRSWREILKVGKGVMVLPHRCADGKTRVFEIRTLVLQKNLIINTWVDVTRRELAENRLQESEVRFRSFFERSSDPFMLFDGANLIDCNLAAQNLFNCQNTREMIGKTLEALSPERQTDGRLTIKKAVSLFKSAEKNGNQRTEWTIKTRDGKIIPVELSITAIILEGRNLLFVVLRDITVQKEAEAVHLNAKTELENAVRARTADLVALNDQLETSREELRHLSEYLQQAREEERTFIAREVHDHVGQFLTRLKMDLAYQVQNPLSDTSVLTEQTKLMIEQVDGAIRSVREICSELRPTIVDHFGFSEAVRWHLKDFQKRTGIRCSVSMDYQIPAPHEDDLNILLFRIFQEAMTNILRHARATRVAVKLTCDGSNLVLKIKDNGKGISKENVMHHRSFGIIGIRERVRFWGGRSEFKGSPNKGTTVTVWLPMRPDISLKEVKKDILETKRTGL